MNSRSVIACIPRPPWRLQAITEGNGPYGVQFRADCSGDLAQCLFAFGQLAEFPAGQIEPLRGDTLAASDPDYFCYRSLTPPQAMGTARPIASTPPRGMAS